MSKEGNAKENPDDVGMNELGNDQGARLKMPAAQLAQVTKAKNKLEESLAVDNVDLSLAAKNVQKYEDEITKLEKQCDLILTLDESQQRQKEEWMNKNVVHCRDDLTDCKKRLQAKGAGAQPVVPRVVLDLVNNDDKESRRSKLSRRSEASSRARQAEAEMIALQMERERLKKRQAQENEERLLRQQREQDDLEAKIQQAKVRQEAFSRAGSRCSITSDIEDKSRKGSLLDLPSALHRTANWIERTAPEANSVALPRVNAREQEQGARNSTIRPPNFESRGATTQLYQQMLLPSSKLPVFNGSYLEFPWFIRSFEMLVEDVTPDPTRRLHLLLQHLEGDPHTLVKGFHLAEPSIAYRLAKQELMQRYGNPIRQSLAFKDQLLSWPALKKDSMSDLEKFFVQLRLCEAMKQSGGGMHELDAPTTLAKLMHKLPQRHQDAWLRRVYRVESTQARETTYNDFTQFVRELSETANHPVFGKQVPQDKITSAKTAMTSVRADDEPSGASCLATANESARSRAKVSIATEESSKDAYRPPCLVCEGNHPTTECKNYELVPLEDRKTKLKGLCFRCLKSDHWARNCKKPATCTKCEGKHPSLLHDERRAPKGNKGTAKATTEQPAPANSAETCGATVSHAPGVGSIAAVPVKIWLNSSRTPVSTLAILDTASSASFISETLAIALGIRITKNTSLTLSTVLDTSGTSTAIVRGLHVADIDGNNGISLPPLYTIPDLPACTEREILKKEVDNWQHLQRVPFAWEEYKGHVGLLLGQDVPDALRPEKVVKGDGPNEPYAALSPLGWTFNGPKDASSRRPQYISATQATSDDDEIASALRRLFYSSMEDLFDFHSKGLSQEDNEWLNQVQSSVCRSPTHPDRFQISLPFKAGTHLLDNRQQAERQLGALRRRFLQNDQFRADYTAFMTKMEQAGYVEPAIDPGAGAGLTSYVPHHGVYHPRKKKLRVVFNCSSKYHGISLNDCLLSGPDLTNSLLGVLIRFRQESVAFIADVESMFYRVLVPADQRDALRYLWWPGGDIHQPPKTYRMAVHLFGATSSPSCANYALRKAAEDAHKEGLVTEAVKEAVHRNFYVDDCLKSMPTEEQAIDMAIGLIKACKHGGFKLTKFVSTSPILLNALPAERLARTIEQNTLEDKHNPLASCLERALGVAWDVKKDHFYFRLSPPAATRVTKRSILSVLSMVYDPIGMAAPVVIAARMLFRELTRDSTTTSSWDEEVNETKSSEWARWLEALPQIQEATLPRCYMRSQEANINNWQLHAFSDSSLDAYAVVIYLRHGKTNPAVTYLVGKARVTPPKMATIPRLELVAAKLATDMMMAVQQELQFTISKRAFWSDSQTVLKYLNCKKRRFHTFVANRVHSILASSDSSEWRFVPTSLNPADEATRGLPAGELATSKWLSGPDFLRRHERDWPHTESPTEPETCDPEVKDVVAIHTNASEEKVPFISRLASQTSSMYRFRKFIAIWMKYRAFLMKSGAKSDEHITVKDLISSELEAVKWLQRDTWPEEIQRLQEGRQVKRASALWKLSPGLVNGLLVMRSRTRVNLPIIPAGPLADLIILEAHQQQLHFGRLSTSAAVLRRVWVIGLNKAVRRLVRACPSCQLRRAQPQPEEMGALPEFRTEASHHAFAVTGVDYFGPFDVKYGARSTTKAYGVIFTCSATRAVHLEAAEDLSSSEFINALRRFMARRGSVQRLITDNGTNFKGAARELNEELQDELERQKNSTVVVQELRRQGIEWTHNAPGASHHGGFWERLIRSIRRAFEAILSIYRPLTFVNFLTLLCEVEAALNARPLTAVSEDPLDLDALTPNHLLLARSGPEPQPGDFSTSTLIRRHWRHIQHLSQIFWKRWVHEYRATLHRRTSWLAKNSRPMRIGDIVLILDPLRHRRYWKLGRVLQIESSDPNRPRAVKVQTQNGTFVRPITKLCLLETASQSEKIIP